MTLVPHFIDGVAFLIPTPQTPIPSGMGRRSPHATATPKVAPAEVVDIEAAARVGTRDATATTPEPGLRASTRAPAVTPRPTASPAVATPSSPTPAPVVAADEPAPSRESGT